MLARNGPPGIKLSLPASAIDRCIINLSTRQYADRGAAEDAHLIVFDRTPDKAWEEKVWRREESHNGLQITVWGDVEDDPFA